uniref:Uncharacterized protein n=1 Tax=Helianthus annuus TaxID=4232 RepID=A0A251TIT3_HELAN
MNQVGISQHSPELVLEPEQPDFGQNDRCWPDAQMLARCPSLPHVAHCLQACWATW